MIRIGTNPAQTAAAIVVASFALLQSAPAQAVNLVTNGDFETGDLTGWTNNIPVYEGVYNPGGTGGQGGNNTNVAYFGAVGELGAIAILNDIQKNIPPSVLSAPSAV